MIPIEKVKLLLIKHQDIEKELSSGKLDAVNFKNKSKEYSELNEIVPYARKYLNFEKVRLAINDHYNFTNYGVQTIWNVITFQIWYKKFLEKSDKKFS